MLGRHMTAFPIKGHGLSTPRGAGSTVSGHHQRGLSRTVSNLSSKNLIQGDAVLIVTSISSVCSGQKLICIRMAILMQISF